MPRPELVQDLDRLGGVGKEPVVRSWGQSAVTKKVLQAWKVGAPVPAHSTSPSPVISTTPRIVCEETGAELEERLPGEFLTTRLDGINRMLRSSARAERHRLGEQLLLLDDPGRAKVRVGPVKRKLDEIVRELDKRMCVDFEAADAEELRVQEETDRLRADAKQKRNARVRLLKEREQELEEEQQEFRANLGAALAAALESEGKAKRWLAEAERAGNWRERVKEEVLKEKQKEAVKVEMAMKDKEERHSELMQKLSARLKHAEQLRERAKEDFDRHVGLRDRLVGEKDEQISAIEDVIRREEESHRKERDVATFHSAKLSHEDLQHEALSKRRDELDNRLKVLESLRANLERALQPRPTPRRGDASHRSAGGGGGRGEEVTLHVTVRVPLAEVSEVFEGAVQDETQKQVLSLVAAAAARSGVDPRDLKFRLYLAGFGASPHAETKGMAAVRVGVRPLGGPSDSEGGGSGEGGSSTDWGGGGGGGGDSHRSGGGGGLSYRSGGSKGVDGGDAWDLAERIRSCFWRCVLEQRVSKGSCGALDLHISRGPPPPPAPPPAHVDLAIDADFDQSMEDQAGFKDGIVHEVATALRVEPHTVSVSSLQRGSVVASVVLSTPDGAVDGRTPDALASELVVQAGDEASPLRSGELGSKVLWAQNVSPPRQEEMDPGPGEEAEDAWAEDHAPLEEAENAEDMEWAVHPVGHMQKVDEVNESSDGEGLEEMDPDKEGLAEMDPDKPLNPEEIASVLVSEGYGQDVASKIASTYVGQEPPSMTDLRASVMPVSQPPSFQALENQTYAGPTDDGVRRPLSHGWEGSQYVRDSRNALFAFSDDVQEFRRTLQAEKELDAAPPPEDVEEEDEDEDEDLPPLPPRSDDKAKSLEDADAPDESSSEEEEEAPLPRSERDAMTAAAISALAKQWKVKDSIECVVSGKEFSFSEAETEKFKDTAIVPAWGVFICADGVRSLRRRDIVGIFYISVEVPVIDVDENGQFLGVTFDAEGNPTGTDPSKVPPGWSRVVGTTGVVVSEQPVELPADVLLANPNAFERKPVDWLGTVQARISDRVLAAVCSDASVPVDRAFEDATNPEQATYVFGDACTACSRWLRSDADVLEMARTGEREVWLFCEVMDALVHGRLHPNRGEFGKRSNEHKLYSGLLERFSTAGMVFHEEGEAGPIAPSAAAPEEGTLGPLRPGKMRILPLKCCASALVFDSSTLVSGLALKDLGRAVQWSGRKKRPFETRSVMTEYSIDASKGATGIDDSTTLHIFEVEFDGDTYGCCLGIMAGSVGNDPNGMKTWSPDHSLRMEYDGQVRGKGMFKSVVCPPDARLRAFDSGSRVAIIFDPICKQIGWLLNGSLVAVCVGLPLLHHEAADLRFMASCRNATVTICTDEEMGKTAQCMDWSRWLRQNQTAAKQTTTTWKALPAMLKPGEMGPPPGKSKDPEWTEEEAIVEFAFAAIDPEDELTVSKGDRIVLLARSEEDKGWFLAELLERDEKNEYIRTGKQGYVPENFIKRGPIPEDEAEQEGREEDLQQTTEESKAETGGEGTGEKQGMESGEGAEIKAEHETPGDQRADSDEGATQKGESKVGAEQNGNPGKGEEARGVEQGEAEENVEGGEEEAFVITSYQAIDPDDELTVSRGDRIVLLARGQTDNEGWRMAELLERDEDGEYRKTGKKGYIPENFIKKRGMTKQPEVPVPDAKPESDGERTGEGDINHLPIRPPRVGNLGVDDDDSSAKETSGAQEEVKQQEESKQDPETENTAQRRRGLSAYDKPKLRIDDKDVAKVKFDFEATAEDELTIREGDDIFIHGTAEEILGEGESVGWAVVQLLNPFPVGRKGLVPETHIERRVKLTGLAKGWGHIDFEDGTVYDGEVLDGRPHGMGTAVFVDCNVYEGEWEEGVQKGQGKYVWAEDGEVYEGEFLDGQSHGYGKFTFADGDIYEGEWQKDVMFGKGRMTFADGSVEEGFFKHGELVDEADLGELTEPATTEQSDDDIGAPAHDSSDGEEHALTSDGKREGDSDNVARDQSGKSPPPTDSGAAKDPVRIGHEEKAKPAKEGGGMGQNPNSGPDHEEEDEVQPLGETPDALRRSLQQMEAALGPNDPNVEEVRKMLAEAERTQ